jgi:membrane associated rhomboid family serine protease
MSLLFPVFLLCTFLGLANLAVYFMLPAGDPSLFASGACFGLALSLLVDMWGKSKS